MPPQDLRENIRIDHLGLQEADHTVVVFRPAHLKADGRQMFGCKHRSAHAVHITAHRLPQSFFHQLSCWRHKLDRPALDDDELPACLLAAT